jgi:hypothetical protein
MKRDHYEMALYLGSRLVLSLSEKEPQEAKQENPSGWFPTWKSFLKAQYAHTMFMYPEYPAPCKDSKFPPLCTASLIWYRYLHNSVRKLYLWLKKVKFMFPGPTAR